MQDNLLCSHKNSSSGKNKLKLQKYVSMNSPWRLRHHKSPLYLVFSRNIQRCLLRHLSLCRFAYHPWRPFLFLSQFISSCSPPSPYLSVSWAHGCEWFSPGGSIAKRVRGSPFLYIYKESIVFAPQCQLLSRKCTSDSIKDSSLKLNGPPEECVICWGNAATGVDLFTSLPQVARPVPSHRWASRIDNPKQTQYSTTSHSTPIYRYTEASCVFLLCELSEGCGVLQTHGWGIASEAGSLLPTWQTGPRMEEVKGRLPCGLHRRAVASGLCICATFSTGLAGCLALFQ